MRRSLQLLTAGAGSLLALIASTGGLCAAGVFKCTVGTQFKWVEAIGPLVLLFLAALLINGIVLAGSAYVVFKARRTQLPLKAAWAVLGGLAAGVLTRLSWEAFTGTFPDTFFPHMEYVPFAVCGAVAALLLVLTGFAETD